MKKLFIKKDRKIQNVIATLVMIILILAFIGIVVHLIFHGKGHYAQLYFYEKITEIAMFTLATVGLIISYCRLTDLFPHFDLTPLGKKKMHYIAGSQIISDIMMVSLITAFFLMKNNHIFLQLFLRTTSFLIVDTFSIGETLWLNHRTSKTYQKRNSEDNIRMKISF